MKKTLLLLFLLPMVVFASTNTFERTTDDLRVPSKIKYKYSMYSSVISTPSVDASEKIYDFADLLKEDEEIKLYNSVNEFIIKYDMDLCIVTINNNSKSSTLVYADDFYDYNDFKSDGLLLVIDMQNRVFDISTAGQAMIYYDNNRIEDVLSSMDYYMSNNYYFDAVNTLIETLSFYADSGFSSNQNKYIIKDGEIYRRTPYLIIGIISLIGSSIITLILALRNKPVKLAVDCDAYLQNGEISVSQDNFISSYTTKTYIPPSDDGHSSFGGGKDFHSSSSGVSHGGGGHRF